MTKHTEWGVQLLPFHRPGWEVKGASDALYHVIRHAFDPPIEGGHIIQHPWRVVLKVHTYIPMKSFGWGRFYLYCTSRLIDVGRLWDYDISWILNVESWVSIFFYKNWTVSCTYISKCSLDLLPLLLQTMSFELSKHTKCYVGKYKASQSKTPTRDTHACTHLNTLRWNGVIMLSMFHWHCHNIIYNITNWCENPK